MENLTSILLNIFAFIGAVVAAGGGIGIIVYGIFKFLAEKWISKKFEEHLADYKHRQQKELEQLKHEISKLMDRATKLHQRKFDVIPEVWAKMNDAYNKACALTSIIQQYSDLTNLSQVQLEEFLATTTLLNWQKDEIRKRDGIERHKYYQQAILPHRINDTWVSFAEFNIYFRKNGIFMPSDIQLKFEGIAEIVFNAVTEFKLNEELELRPRERKAHKVLHEQGEQMVRALQTDVQSRLWAGMTTSAP